MSRLVCTEGPDKGTEYALQDGVNDGGRSDVVQIRLSDRNCSRVHFRIEKERLGFTLEDANSRNGTFLNGKPVMHKVTLKAGDVIMLGSTRLEYDLGEATTADRRDAVPNPAGQTVVGVGDFLKRLLGKHG